jgi:hypothetical protein
MHHKSPVNTPHTRFVFEFWMHWGSAPPPASCTSNALGVKHPQRSYGCAYPLHLKHTRQNRSQYLKMVHSRIITGGSGRCKAAKNTSQFLSSSRKAPHLSSCLLETTLPSPLRSRISVDIGSRATRIYSVGIAEAGPPGSKK